MARRFQPESVICVRATIKTVRSYMAFLHLLPIQHGRDEAG